MGIETYIVAMDRRREHPVRIRRAWQDILYYYLKIHSHAVLCHEQYTIGHLYVSKDISLTSRYPNGLFSLMHQQRIIGFVLLWKSEVVQIFSSNRSPLDWLAGDHTFVVDSHFYME